MKVVVITIMILIMFFVGSIWLNHYISESIQGLVDQIEQLDEAIEAEDWEKAKVDLEELNKDWNNTKKRWQIFLEHNEIDSMDIALAKVKRYVALEEVVTSLGELAQLRMLVKHVEEKNVLKITNIL